MYFIPHMNRLYARIVQLKPPYRYLLTLFSVALLIITWLFGLYFRLEAKIHRYQMEVTQLHQQNLQCIDAKRSCSLLASTIRQLRTNLASYTVNAADANDMYQSQVLFVLDQVQRTGLSLTAYSAERETDKDWYLRGSAHFNVHGSMQNITRFLQTLKTSQKMIKCKDVSCTRTQGDTFSANCHLCFTAIKPQKKT